MLPPTSLIVYCNCKNLFICKFFIFSNQKFIPTIKFLAKFATLKKFIFSLFKKASKKNFSLFKKASKKNFSFGSCKYLGEDEGVTN